MPLNRRIFDALAERMLKRLSTEIDDGYAALFINGVEQPPRHHVSLSWRIDERGYLQVKMDREIHWSAETAGIAELKVFDCPEGGEEICSTETTKDPIAIGNKVVWK